MLRAFNTHLGMGKADVDALPWKTYDEFRVIMEIMASKEAADRQRDNPQVAPQQRASF